MPLRPRSPSLGGKRFTRQGRADGACAALRRRHFAAIRHALECLQASAFRQRSAGEKTYAFYSASQKLLIFARKTGKIWDLCTIREAVAGRNSLIDWSLDWPNEFDSSFPALRYIRLDGRFGPPFGPVALRCEDQRAAFVVYPHFGNESEFSVSVSNAPEQAHLRLPEKACQGQ